MRFYHAPLTFTTLSDPPNQLDYSGNKRTLLCGSTLRMRNFCNSVRGQSISMWRAYTALWFMTYLKHLGESQRKPVTSIKTTTSAFRAGGCDGKMG